MHRYCVLRRKQKYSALQLVFPTAHCTGAYLFLRALYRVNSDLPSLCAGYLGGHCIYLRIERKKNCYLRGVMPCSQVQLHGSFRAGLVNVRPLATSKVSRIQFNEHSTIGLQNIISLTECDSGTTKKFPFFCNVM